MPRVGNNYVPVACISARLKKARTCPDWLANDQGSMMKIAGSGSIS